MEVHPVPQNISSYEFRLVGDMTLKQFMQLALGIVLVVFMFRLPLSNLIRFPLAFIFVIVGAALAFLPINNRPFSAWLSAFLKAIYSPTEYYWTAPSAQTAGQNIPQSPSVVPPPAQVVTGFGGYVKDTLTAPKPAESAPPSAAPPPASTTSPVVTGGDLPVLPITTFAAAPPAPSPLPPQPTTTTFIKADLPPQTSPPLPAVSSAPVSEASVVDTAPQSTPVFSAPPVITAPVTLPLDRSPSIVPAAAPPPPAATTTAITPPTTPNILVGMATDNQGQFIPGVTIEIIDTATGIPARALRTNRLGQFQIAIPLPDGTYTINAEKDNFLFDPVSVRIQHDVIPPVIIKAK